MPGRIVGALLVSAAVLLEGTKALHSSGSDRNLGSIYQGFIDQRRASRANTYYPEQLPQQPQQVEAYVPVQSVPRAHVGGYAELAALEEHSSQRNMASMVATEPARKPCWKWNGFPASTQDEAAPVGGGMSAWRDQDTDLLHVFGGCSVANDPRSCFTDVASLNTTTMKWAREKISNAADSPGLNMLGQAWAHDPVSNIVFVFGGYRLEAAEPQTAGAKAETTAAFSNAMDIIYKDKETAKWKWMETTVGGVSPPPTQDSTLTLYKKSLILFGGSNDQGFHNSIYIMPMSGEKEWTWLEVKVSGTPPSPRRGHTATLTSDGQLWVFGGSDATSTLNDVFVLKIGQGTGSEEDPFTGWAWSQISVTVDPKVEQPKPRAFHSATLVEGGQSIVVYGGCDLQEDECYDETLVLDITPSDSESRAVWRALPQSLIGTGAHVSPAKGQGRRSHVLVATNNGATDLLLVGGCGSNTCYDDVSQLDLRAVCAGECGAHGAFQGGEVYTLEAHQLSGHAKQEYKLAGADECLCGVGFKGKYCDAKADCQADCHSRWGQGRCVLSGAFPGQHYCECNEGFFGLDCGVPECDADLASCSAHGVCRVGEAAAAAGGKHVKSLLQLHGDGDASKDGSSSSSSSGTQAERERNAARAGVRSANLAEKKQQIRLQNTLLREVKADVGGHKLLVPVKAQPMCKCLEGFLGRDCSQPAPSQPNEARALGKVRCPKGCSGHGLCVEALLTQSQRKEFEDQNAAALALGKLTHIQAAQMQGMCQCEAGFSGDDCSVQCPDLCNGRGACLSNGQCECSEGFSGIGCREQHCAKDCSDNGMCTNGQCWCSSPWVGEVCSKDSSCSGHGVFHNERCVCDDGWGMADCSEKLNCFGGCSGHGRCRSRNPVVGMSLMKVFKSKAQVKAEAQKNAIINAEKGEAEAPAPSFLSLGDWDGLGYTLQGQCECDEFYSGPNCERKACLGGCSDNGVCQANGECSCFPGFTGKDCSHDLGCPSNCTNHLHGKCLPVTTQAAFQVMLETVSSPDSPLSALQLGELGAAHMQVGSMWRDEERRDEALRALLFVSESGDGSKAVSKDATKPARSDAASASTSSDYVGACECTEDWMGEACQQLRCKADCNNHGECINGQCRCAKGFSGDACELTCEKGCGKAGECVMGKCVCDAEHEGEACESLKKCPVDKASNEQCGGRGKCHVASQTCMCRPGYSGKACEVGGGECPNACSHHGTCKEGVCFCDVGFGGESCDKKAECKDNCNNRGVCQVGSNECKCLAGFTGPACEEFVYDKTCKTNCTNHGYCEFGRCFCASGFTGDDCSEPVGTCGAKKGEVVCSGKGVCEYGKCFCQPGAAGDRCEKTDGKCEGNCDHGMCHAGKCHCQAGFSGVKCDQPKACPAGKVGGGACSGRGICVLGECACEPGYGGEACGDITVPELVKTKCKNNCTNAGVCHAGKCFCVPGRTGEECSIVTPAHCPSDCKGEDGQSNGVCLFGQCFCKPGFEGKDCRQTKSCSEKCLRNGVCSYGKCFCVAGWGGPDCDQLIGNDRSLFEKDVLGAQKTCDASGLAVVLGGACSGTNCGAHGVCVEGQCRCEVGYAGKGCTQVVGGDGPLTKRCPADCHSQGQCLFGKCFCFPGFGGKSCQERVSMPCPGDCSGHGICHMGFCNCDFGFSGLKCDKEAKCEHDCGRHGVCVSGQCQCVKGFEGETCSTAAKKKKILAAADGTIVDDAEASEDKKEEENKDDGEKKEEKEDEDEDVAALFAPAFTELNEGAVNIVGPQQQHPFDQPVRNTSYLVPCLLSFIMGVVVSSGAKWVMERHDRAKRHTAMLRPLLEEQGEALLERRS